MATKLSDNEVAKQLERAPDWSEISGEIQRTFQFDDFKQSMAFVNRVADYAERAQHHPDMMIRYDKVTLTVSTHDAGGITAQDFELADYCDSIAEAG
ncbi:MAG: putative pterin-4-alpha-carbinolamine dehydratase [Phycisphaeraceae bacterium]|nr:MAG: putative pterin-4-alpha-carbinolamine dehydratase [Phycisphaeraceae bacterium]